MRFLIDRCAGTVIATWLRSQGHDVVESRELGPDPGDPVLLEWAANESRILITIDTDFGQLIFLKRVPHRGLIRLPDVPAAKRVQIIEDLLVRFSAQLEENAVITVRGGRVRISRSPHQ
jgi:predicted nuclease of predicted toxin-antitoxin system